MKWGSTSIVYGGDHMHYTSELCGEQELPFEEGLGTYYGDTQNHPTAYTNLIADFARSNERYVLESRAVLAGTQAIWNAPHTERSLSLMSLPDPADRTGSYAVREYRWRDVPGFYLLFSESTTTGFNLFFWRTANNDPTRADQMIGTVARALARDRRKRYLTYEANRLALQMEAFAATPQGAAARTAGTLTSSLYPFALLDVLTHFGMSDPDYRADYDRHYPDAQPRAYAEYFNRRAAIRAIADPFLNSSPVRIAEAVDAVHRYCQRADAIVTP